MSPTPPSGGSFVGLVVVIIIVIIVVNAIAQRGGT
jgi:hypothetical protein